MSPPGGNPGSFWPWTPDFPFVADLTTNSAGDPHVGENGIWLGPDVTPSACFRNLKPTITDADKDWLDDNCELALARGFAPRWNVSVNDGCPSGEPAWAAKYFLPAVVRIAYLPAYHDDCGTPYLGFGPGHFGDSEMVTVEVEWNSSTSHWEFRNMWLSAHYLTSNDRSMWANANQTTFTTHPLAHPSVTVALAKHANYTNESKCENHVDFAGTTPDHCDVGYGYHFRIPVAVNRNVGSRFVGLLGCVGSMSRFAGNGRTECFHGPNPGKPFNGWHAGEGGESAYATMLTSDKFERKGNDWGPGPYDPGFAGPPPLNGPLQLRAESRRHLDSGMAGTSWSHMLLVG